MPKRVLIAAGVVGLAVLAALAAAGFKAGMLDREVLTQSTMSFRYRWEYWQGAVWILRPNQIVKRAIKPIKKI